MALAAMLPRMGIFRVTGVRWYGGVYKSAYSLDKLYPDSVTRQVEENIQDYTHIPVERLTISYSKSSGPGGQNVNKVNSKAESKNRINKEGELIVSSEISRYQMRNLADCLDKVRNIICEAVQKPKPPTKEDIELRKTRLENTNRERLRQKKVHSATKQNRSVLTD